MLGIFGLDVVTVPQNATGKGGNQYRFYAFVTTTWILTAAKQSWGAVH
jgi:hypothetical protein